MNYGRILRRAWQITWNYRALWIVGLLLVLAGGGVGQGMRYSGGLGDHGRGGSSGSGYGPPPSLGGMWHRLLPALAGVATVVVLVVLLVLALSVLAAVVRFVTRTSLIQMVDGYEEEGEQIGVWDALRRGWSAAAWRLFLIHLAFWLPLVLVALLLIAALLVPIVWVAASEARGWVAIVILLAAMFVPAFLLLSLVRLLVVPIIEMADRACVLEGRGVMAAIGTGWRLVRENLVAVGLMWLILVAMIIGWSIVTAIVFLVLLTIILLVVGVPALLLGVAAAALLAAPAGMVLGLLLLVPVMLVVLVPVGLALATLSTVYYSTTWTLVYRELRGQDEGVQSVPVAA